MVHIEIALAGPQTETHTHTNTNTHNQITMPPPALTGDVSPTRLGPRVQQGQCKVRALLLADDSELALCALPPVMLARGLGCYKQTWCRPRSPAMKAVLQGLDDTVRQLCLQTDGDDVTRAFPWQPLVNNGRFVVESRHARFYEKDAETGMLTPLTGKLGAKSLRGRRVAFHVRPVVVYASWRGVKHANLRFYAEAAVVLPADTPVVNKKRCRPWQRIDDFGALGIGVVM